MLEIRRDSWWARCWRDEPIPVNPLPDGIVVRVLDAPTSSPPASRSTSFGIERWQHLGGVAGYALLGFEFQPAATGQLVVLTREIEDAEWREPAAEALSSVKWALADELGPGRLTLTSYQHDEVDTSVASIASAACAAAFVATRALDEIEREADRLLLRPCQFEGDVRDTIRLPDSLAGRATADGLILAGPWIKGDVRVGDELTIEHSNGSEVANVLSFPRIRYGSNQPNWHSIEVDLDEGVEIPLPAIVTGVSHWRPPIEQPDLAVSDE